MALALGAVSTSSNATNSTSITWDHITVAGDNIIVIIVMAQDSTSTDMIPVAASCSYNGNVLTNAQYNSDGLQQSASIRYLVNPPIGTYSIVHTVSGKCTDLQGCAISLSGADVLDPIDVTDAPYAISGANPSTTFSTQHNYSWLIQGYISDLASITSIAALDTEIHRTDVGAFSMCSQYRTGLVTGVAGSKTIGWTADTTTDTILCTVAIKAVLDIFQPKMGFTSFANGVGII